MSRYKECPYCSEEILASAKKCKYCGEFLVSRRGGWIRALPYFAILLLIGYCGYKCEELNSPEAQVLRSLNETLGFIDDESLNKDSLRGVFEQLDLDSRSSLIDSLEHSYADQIGPARKDNLRKKLINEQFSSWDHAHIKLKRLVKEGMNDPSSFEHVKTAYEDKGDHLLVQMQFRGLNAFGGKVLNQVIAKVDLEGNILEIVEQ